MKKLVKYCLLIIRAPILALIWLYQRTISPDHGFVRIFFPHGYCKYYPSCSEYARLSIKKRGIIVGLVKSAWRILKCNPWSRGGIDLP